ncbi:hypothetical protein RRG08_056466 [Elysia crispata]|uniref:Uncharacterized protein n=1 Tax=Elysia crispata TaxID=231223 RepID=A0AAE0XRR3_9GAST|nr:hypothetical protein RRG08_056466 [Elysia crispata]
MGKLSGPVISCLVIMSKGLFELACRSLNIPADTLITLGRLVLDNISFKYFKFGAERAKISARFQVTSEVTTRE